MRPQQHRGAPIDPFTLTCVSRRYASGATIQILLFAILAIQVKIRAPAMHTYLETIYIRWGTGPHIIFMIFGFMCNCIVTSMLMLGGAATIEQLTGVHKTWSAFLIPIGVWFCESAAGASASAAVSTCVCLCVWVCDSLFSISLCRHFLWWTPRNFLRQLPAHRDHFHGPDHLWILRVRQRHRRRRFRPKRVHLALGVIHRVSVQHPRNDDELNINAPML